MTGAREYHERTKHTPRSVREGSHRMDPENRPTSYKVYEDLPRRELADRIRPPRQPALSAIAEPTPDGVPEASDADLDPATDLDRGALTQLCYYSNGITKRIARRGREHLFRAAACTGALYHVDLYAVCGDLGDLDAGVYHFDPRTLSLDVLREGDYRDVLANAAGRGAVERAPLTFVATSTWWRNAWKYRERTFRHAFWDSGTVLANLLAVAHALDLRAEAVLGFADEPVAALLGVDPAEEAPLELVPVGTGDAAPPAPDVDPIAPETEPLSPNPIDYPLLSEAWQAGTLPDGEAAAAWRERAVEVGSTPRAERPGVRAPGDGERVALDPVDYETQSARPLHETIRRRGSCREYERDEVSFRKFSTVLDRATRGAPLDVRLGEDGTDPAGDPLQFVDPYLLVNGVEGLEAGVYRYRAAERELERLRSGDCRGEATELALEQPLAGDAAVCAYFLADVDDLVDALGDRGYRAAQFEAAATAGRLYLATYAHRDLGGTGLTFYDDAVTDFLSPAAAGQTPMFLYTLGRPA